MLKITFTNIEFDNSLLTDNIPMAILVDEHKKLDSFGQSLDETLQGMLQHHLNIVDFKGKALSAQISVIPHDAGFVGLLGKGNIANPLPDLAEISARHIGASLVETGKKIERSTIRLLADIPASAMVHIACGAILNHYEFKKYITKTDSEKTTLDEIIIIGPQADEAQKLFDSYYLPLMQGVCLTRDLVSEPANKLYPQNFAEICQTLSKDGLEVTLLDEKKMQALGMGALLSVAQGSAHKPYLVTMQWKGGDPSQKPIAIVGKGVTFDTGGISIKPAAGMEEMKWDMGGAGVVTGLMKSLACRKAPINVVGIIGLVENMPSGTAMRPGDVITSLSGQSIEVLNTDAEGRLVLADAICYAQQNFDPEIIIDLATLTGAMIIALGHDYAGIFSNDDALADSLIDAGIQVDEKIWRLPLDSVYDKMLQSPIADMKNIGGRPAGSITAAQFIQRFVNPGVKWAHFDIAGVAWLNKAKPCYPKGASGFAVQLLNRYLENLTKADK